MQCQNFQLQFSFHLSLGNFFGKCVHKNVHIHQNDQTISSETNTDVKVSLETVMMSVTDGDERVNGTLRKRGGFIHSCWVSQTHSTHDSPMAAAFYADQQSLIHIQKL